MNHVGFEPATESDPSPRPVAPPSALGAFPTASGATLFRVWTTTASRVGVRLFSDEKTATRTVPLERRSDGVFEATVPGVGKGALYKFVLDDDEVPDPYARFLPFGVHGPAEVVERKRVESTFRRAPLEKLIVYELHVGTFTPEGTYQGAARRLPDLAALGVNAIELLPVASFPGTRGWGYDGVAPFAPFAPYGRPDDLRALIAQAHALDIAVLLDVVYNHLGPQGNYIPSYSPTYLAKAGVWGESPDFANPRVRALALDNARMWFDEYGFDGLRLDATHAIHDPTDRSILRELADLAHGYDPPRLLAAEDDRNDPGLVTDQHMDAIWADDFHHQVHVLLTTDRDGYYAAYEPTVEALARTIERGWIYEGQSYPGWSAPRGKPADALEPASFVYCIQNHDQVGNRALGTRLDAHCDADGFRVASALLLFLPMTPLLFMGQEWAASTPFLFFTDHEPSFGEVVSKGRREEFKHFASFVDPRVRASIPDPQATETFERSKLRWEERDQEPHRRTLAFVRDAIALRRRDEVLSARCDRSGLEARAEGDVLVVTRRSGGGTRTFVANFGTAPAPAPRGVAGTPLLATHPHSNALPTTLPPHSAYVLD